MTPRDRIPALLSLEQISLLLERTLEESPADETELVWIECRRGEAAAHGKRVEARQAPQRTILVRVLDRGRVGSFRTSTSEIGELQHAVRMAIGQSRVREPLQGLPHLPADQGPAPQLGGLHDRALAELRPAEVSSMLGELLGRHESADLLWTESRVAVFNSRKVRRTASVTAAQLNVSTGRRPGAGGAGDAARSLAGLPLAELVEQARARHGGGSSETAPEAPVPLVLSAQATAVLIDLMNRVSFSAKSYYDGTSFLREHVNIQVFDRGLDLVDDATDPAGLPFPFDLEGTPKRRVALIQQGAPKTPTLDQRQAAVLGLPPTAHAIGGNDARAEHLFLAAGELSEAELLTAAEGGLWIGAIDHIESLEPRRVHFRARLSGARRIEGGALAAPVEDLVWEDSLLRALSDLAGRGATVSRRLSADGFSGAICAPAIALGPVEGLRAAPVRG